jgi:hypothetical protein
MGTLGLLKIITEDPNYAAFFWAIFSKTPLGSLL